MLPLFFNYHGRVLPAATSIVFIIIFYSLGKLLCRTIAARMRVRRLKGLGIPIAPHSLLFGHIPMFADFGRAHPPDVNIHHFHTWLASPAIRKKYFPGLDKLPPVVYLDLCPVGPSFALVYDPIAAAQFTQDHSLPKLRHSVEYLKPLTQNKDIVSTEGHVWKVWRSRFSPGFSSRNMIALLPELIEDVTIFARRLQSRAGEHHTFGQVFPLKELATDLAFDSICRATLGMRLDQQSKTSDTPLKKTLLDQVRSMNLRASELRGLLHRRMPWHTAMVAKNNRIMNSLINPFILQNLQSEERPDKVKTVISLAVQSLRKGDRQIMGSRSEPRDDFIDVLGSNIKAFLFAGQDTTASTICFMMKCLQENHDCLAELRAEHDLVLGPDPGAAPDTLRSQPHLLYQLPYTLGVIKETLRLHTLASTARQAHGEFSVTARDSTIPYPLQGFAPWIAAPAIHRDPDYWPRPNDFLPERWTKREGDSLYPCKEAWMPFSLGPRNCIGMELAMTELRLVCVLVARSFDMEPAWGAWDEKRGTQATPGHQVDGERLYGVDTGPVQPKDGMPVHVRTRKVSRE
ncbi:cytochrome P450 4V3 [Xylariaceae sp. FL0016]|nr:cytochrome P450 4V3 [Xylariaceae sp. FL0016]